MDVIFPDAGLLYLLRQAASPSLIYDLFTNDINPNLSTLLADFTRGNWNGYAPVTVPLSAWSTQLINGHVGTFQAPDIHFNNLGAVPAIAYGYYVKDSSNSILVACARFDLAPVTILPAGFYPVAPTLGTYSALAS